MSLDIKNTNSRQPGLSGLVRGEADDCAQTPAEGLCRTALTGNLAALAKETVLESNVPFDCRTKLWCSARFSNTCTNKTVVFNWIRGKNVVCNWIRE